MDLYPLAENLKSAIENANQGDIIYLPNGDIEIVETISVPSGVTIIGSPYTRLMATSANVASVFDITGSDTVSIKSVQFILEGGVAAVNGSQATHVLLDRLTVIGNLAVAEGQAGFPVVRLIDSASVVVSNSMIADAFGGVYVLESDDVVLSGNQLSNVYYGQFVVSGSDFEISNNLSVKAGVVPEDGSLVMQGDGVTALGVSGLNISNNVFDTGYCYLVSFSAGLNENVIIDSNAFLNGVTHAVHVYEGVSVRNIQIVSNLFSMNAGTAIALEGDVDFAVVTGNEFVGDGIVLGAAGREISISGNDGLIATNEALNYEALTTGNFVFGRSLDDLVPEQLSGVAVTAGVIPPSSPSLNQDALEYESGGVLPLSEIIDITGGEEAIQIIDADGTLASSVILLGGEVVSGLVTLTPAQMATAAIQAGDSARTESFFVRVLRDGVWSTWERLSIYTSPPEVTADNLYHVEFPNDVILEQSDQGVDWVESSASWYELPQNLENIRLVGQAWAAFGNELNNVLEGNALDNYLASGSGDDLLQGMGGSDQLEGAAGDDVLEGGDGDDSLAGGAGNDQLWGGSGDDRLDGGAGADYLAGGLGDDVYVVADQTYLVSEREGEGYDRVFASSDFALAAGSEVEALIAASSGVHLTGNDAGNLIVAGALNVRLSGQGGNDDIRGAAGDDVLEGGDGDDRLAGGGGSDMMTGGAGADRFILTTADLDFGETAAVDVILDFDLTEGDRIDLRGIDAVSEWEGWQSFSFIGQGDFSAVAGQLRYEHSNGNTYLMGDVDGDGAADFMLQLDGLHGLSSNDFLL
ncbi:M10 family metallopeptidase C-terminal domain-containing protein [Brevundimonas sp.]|uniref:calcium-binding protein n=1 Tax=Brevundimonas sp. TaxID=1871086 RepID=UPI0035AF7F17